MCATPKTSSPSLACGPRLRETSGAFSFLFGAYIHPFEIYILFYFICELVKIK